MTGVLWILEDFIDGAGLALLVPSLVFAFLPSQAGVVVWLALCAVLSGLWAHKTDRSPRWLIIGALLSVMTFFTLLAGHESNGTGQLLGFINVPVAAPTETEYLLVAAGLAFSIAAGVKLGRRKSEVSNGA